MGIRILDRRTILRGMLGGAAVGVGLPLLEAMLNDHGDALADGKPLPKRFISWFFFNGVRLDRFEPTATGAGYPLSEELAPLAAVQDYLTVCTGMQNKCAQQIWGHEGMTAFNGYSFQYMGGLSSVPGGPTLDQVIADAIGDVTPVRAVHCGVSKRMSQSEGGTTPFALSHGGPMRPNFPEHNPQNVWNALFGGYAAPADDRALRQSILDAVKEDISAMRPRLGKGDNTRLDAHLESVHALEKKLDAPPFVCGAPGMPIETNQDINGKEPLIEVNKVMSDLITYAFSCDITRVATVMFTGACGALTQLDDIGETVPHHFTVVNGGDVEVAHQGTLYFLERFAYLLGRLKETLEPGGTNLLDSAIVYASSDCAEANTHSIARQPVLVAGHGRGSLVYPGIHYQATPQPGSTGNISDVLLSCLRAFDPSAASVGKDAPMSTTPLVEILGAGG